MAKFRLLPSAKIRLDHGFRRIYNGLQWSDMAVLPPLLPARLVPEHSPRQFGISVIRM